MNKIDGTVSFNNIPNGMCDSGGGNISTELQSLTGFSDSVHKYKNIFSTELQSLTGFLCDDLTCALLSHSENTMIT